MNLFTFNNGDDYEETITDTKAISGECCECCEGKWRVRGFFIGVSDGPVARSAFE
jgi:hypothetical protein